MERKLKVYINESEDPWGLMKAGIDRRRASLIERCIGKAGRVLDVGCGFGIYSDFMEKFENIVVALDASKRMVRDGKKRFRELPFVSGSGERLPFKEGTFDAVLCMGTLIYSKSKELFLSELHRVLRNGGTLCVIERNRNSPMHSLVRKLKRSEKSVDDPAGFFSKGELERLVSGAGFTIKTVSGDVITLPVFSKYTHAIAEKVPTAAYFIAVCAQKRITT